MKQAGKFERLLFKKIDIPLTRIDPKTIKIVSSIRYVGYKGIRIKTEYGETYYFYFKKYTDSAIEQLKELIKTTVAGCDLLFSID